MRSGTLKWLDAEKGYGFISPADGGEDVFVRASSLEAAGLGGIEPGADVTFEVARSEDGLQATDIAAA